MPLSTVDDTVALIIVDLQAGIVARVGDALAPVIDNNAQLARAFRAAGQPVVLVNVDAGAPGRTDQQRPPIQIPAEAMEILPELEPAGEDIRVTKQTWGAFHGTGLHDALQARGVTQVVVTGVATSAGVESTARAAHEHGYHVVLATDAMADMDPEAHAYATGKLFPRLGETTTTAELLDALPS